MAERLARLDAYLRSPDTSLAKAIQRVAPEKGRAYRTSKKKKFLGKTAATAMVVFGTPLIGGLALAKKAEAIMLEGGGTAFYRSPRIGKEGVIFDMWKIRTLYKDAPRNEQLNLANALTPGIPDDPRSTPLGKPLRRWHLDELPQLYQVLTGEMALIGNRPGTETSWQIMRARRTTGVQELFDEEIIAEPGAINPQAAFGKKGTPEEDYLLRALYVREATLGFDLYTAFRTVARHFLKKK